MMSPHVGILSILLAALAAAVAAAGSGRVPYAAPALPAGWVEREGGEVPDHHSITLRLSLRQRNLEELSRRALRVSDPRSATYGQYLSAEEIRGLTEPLAAHVTAVEGWLRGSGLAFKRSGEVVELRLAVSEASGVLRTGFRTVEHWASGLRVVQAMDFSLPSEVDEAVAAIYGLHGLPPAPPPVPRAGRLGDVEYNVTPAVLASTYRIAGAGIVPSGSLKNRQAVSLFFGDMMNRTDLREFFRTFVPSAPAEDAEVHHFVDGGLKDAHIGPESGLDIQTMMGLAPGVLAEFWGPWGDFEFCGGLKNWTAAVLADADPPKVFSVSAGGQSASPAGCKQSSVADVEADFVKLAARGITVIFASGDSGAGWSSFDEKLYPAWPASSPWVTAVGSTTFQGGPGTPEVASRSFGSGGGFSAMYPAFEAQVSAVQSYLSSVPGLPPAGTFPRGGRATPDVSMLGEGYASILMGHFWPQDGTSASAPAFAAMVSLLNEARLQKGLPAMGHLNPWLYQHPDVFTDITVGTNAMDVLGKPTKFGFACARGWDPVTGLGTPLFDKMLEAALGNPTVALLV